MCQPDATLPPGKCDTEKQEVLHQQHCYISQHAPEIKTTLCPAGEVVHGFKVFGDNTQIYATYVLATLEWGRMYHHYGGRDPVLILPDWLTLYIRVSKELRTNADLPKKHVHIGHSDVH